jgi:hypothetical protein
MKNLFAQVKLLALDPRFWGVAAAIGLVILEPATLLPLMVVGAVVNTKSTTITNLDAAQVKRASAFANGAPLKEFIETVEIANGDSVGSTFRFFRVPSWMRVSELIGDWDDIGTTGAADFGLYKTAADGGAVVDADFFASAVVLNTGALANQQLVHESAVVDLPNYGKRIWEQLGLTEDPKIYYDVVATLTGAADAAGTLTLRLRGTEV